MNKEEFIDSLKKLNIDVTEEKLSLLEEYYNILLEENSKYNLTRITDKEEAYLKHFYDSLTITKVVDIDKESVCDMGSGAGFPGLVLAIVFPNSKLTLIESNGKKCYFLNLVKDKLKLDNVEVINDRIEEYSKNNREIFDIVTARAVAPLKHLFEYGVPLVKVDGYFIAMKANIDNEIDNIDNYYKKLDIKEVKREVFNLINDNGLRTIIKYKKECKTNIKYPRRYAEIIKKDI